MSKIGYVFVRDRVTGDEECILKSDDAWTLERCHALLTQYHFYERGIDVEIEYEYEPKFDHFNDFYHEYGFDVSEKGCKNEN